MVVATYCTQNDEQQKRVGLNFLQFLKHRNKFFLFTDFLFYVFGKYVCLQTCNQVYKCDLTNLAKPGDFSIHIYVLQLARPLANISD